MRAKDTAPLDSSSDGAPPFGNDPGETQRLSRSFIGQKMGEFRIIKEIGHGSMGIVFEATHESLGRRVALKVLPPSLSVTETVIRRFLREAQSVARLSHENIVQIHEIGDQAGVFFYAMQFVEGQSLDRMLRERAFTPRECATICAAVARALFFAHEQGIIHRDIKPGNIILTYKDEPVVTDFGLARPEKAATLTESGALVGTPMYMSPEQVRGDRAHIDRRTDIYSLGVTLYEMLSGRAPFEATSTQEVLRKIEFEEAKPLRRVSPDVPRDLATICQKSMEKDPIRRYQTAIEFALDLERHLSGDAIQARPTSMHVRLWRRAKRHRVISTLAVLLLVALGITVAQFMSGRKAKDQIENAESRADLAELANLMTTGGDQQSLQKWSDALRIYSRAIELAPDYSRARIERGRCLFFLQRYEDALMDLEFVHALEPDNVYAKLWCGIAKSRLDSPVLQKEGHTIVGSTIGEVLFTGVTDAACLREAAKTCLAYLVYAQPTQQQQYLALAHRSIGSVLEHDQRDDEALIIQGRLYEYAGILETDQNLIDLAFENYDQAKTINPMNADAWRHFNRDKDALLESESSPTQEQKDDAARVPSLIPFISMFNEELALAGVGLDLVMSRTVLDQQLVSTALKAIRAAGDLPFLVGNDSLDPATEARLNKMLTEAKHRWNDGRYIAAGALYYETLEIDPDLVGPRQRLAEHYMNMGFHDQARREIERALDLEPSNPRTLFLAYQIYREQGDQEKMQEVLEASLEFGHQQLRELLEKFQ